MDGQGIFAWVDFYQEFADKLLLYKNKRQELIEKVKRMFEMTGINMPLLEADNEIVDMDPFTVFGLFNKGLTDANRSSILKAFAELFQIKAEVPLRFDGIPVLNNLKATFYWFKQDRKENDIQNLWELFDAALRLADEDRPENRIPFSDCFNRVITQNGIRWNITMGLYWIRPNYYLSLDSRNRWYLSDAQKHYFTENSLVAELKTVPQAELYLKICDACKASLLKENPDCNTLSALTHSAWAISEQVNEQNRSAKDKEDGKGIGDENITTVHYWLYSPGDNAKIWDECYDNGIMAIGWDRIGDLSDYQSKEEMRQKMQELMDPNLSWKMAALATWQFANEMKPGDVIFAKRGMHTIIGKGIVESDYQFDSQRKHYKNVRKVRWTNKGEWPHPGQAAMKTMTDITRYTDYVEKLNGLFVDEESIEETETEIDIPVSPKIPLYSPEDFLNDVYMDEHSYETLVALIRTKKNVILQGAPGVGKTYAAKRLAYSMMGEKDAERVMMVQFHQSYSYEDFIMGFRPSEKGFELKHGAFYTFCKKAEEDSDNEYFFIIDEINRGNLSKIFGELFMLIESDKRNIELRLLYANEKFSVPANVYIIGMMNTADRSLAMLDYALRRRFAFFEMKPGFETDGFRTYRMGLHSERFDRLIQCVENLNNVIAADESLGEGFCIGHSYFCNLKEADEQTLSNIVEFELIPLLKEYWFDEPTKVKDWTNNLRSAIK